MKHMILIAALCAIATSARAQQTPPSDPATNLVQDFQAYLTSQKHVVQDMDAIVQEAQQQKKQIEDLTKQLGEAKKPTADAPAANAPSLKDSTPRSRLLPAPTLPPPEVTP